MKTINQIQSIILVIALGALALTTTSCNKDDEEKSEIVVRMTDAPADDGNIQAVVVTVAGVMVDGQPLGKFEKQSIEISSYTEGESTIILSDEIEVGAHSSIELLFDTETAADGTSPGCYVLTDDGTKHDLNSSGSFNGSVSLSTLFTSTAGSRSEVIVDMDLRKCVQRERQGASSSDEYEFVAQSDFNAAFRASDIQATGTISGTYSNTFHSSDHVVVYAYKKGTYSSAEANADANTDVRFKNAETSAVVNADGSYTLAFLEAGDYELHGAKYREGADRKSEFESELSFDLLIGGNLLNIVTVEAQSELIVTLQ